MNNVRYTLAEMVEGQFKIDRLGGGKTTRYQTNWCSDMMIHCGQTCL